MTPIDWAGIAVALVTLVTAFAGLVRWLVKHYLVELKPNGGSSLKDKVNALEQKVDILTDIVQAAIRR
jgi:hypothetical protein